jgi:hypothetical protein
VWEILGLGLEGEGILYPQGRSGLSGPNVSIDGSLFWTR